jgi:hypothetical protein
LYSRQVIGWAMEATMSQNLTLRALSMALQRQRPQTGLVHRNCFRNGPLGVKPPNASRRRFHASVRGQHAAATPCDQKEPASRSHKA